MPRPTKPDVNGTDPVSAGHVGRGADVLRLEIAFVWRIHVMSYLMAAPVQPNITARFGLSLVAWRVVITLARSPGLTANEIVETWHLEKMAVSRAVRQLVGAGLVERAADPADHRRQLMSLTPDGQSVYEAAWPRAEEHYRKLTSVLSEHELMQFNAMADKLIAEARLLYDHALTTAMREPPPAALPAGRRPRPPRSPGAGRLADP